MAASPLGLQSTYDLTAGVIIDMESTIYWQNPDDVPLLGQRDFGTWDLGVPRGTVFEKKYEWLEDALLLPQSICIEALDDSETDVSVTVGEGIRFQANNVILIDAEYMLVTAVNISTDVLTVTRGFNSSVAATHLINSPIDITGLILPEGSDPQQARTVDRSGKFNYTQIFGPEKISTTGTEDVIRKYGMSGREHDFQVAKRLKELWIGLEKAIINGDRLEDTTNERRSMGGLRFFITGAANVDSSTTTITEPTLLNGIEAAFNKGGNITTALMGFKQKRTIGGFDSTLIRYSQMETTRGHVVDTIISDGGALRLGLDRWVKNSDLFLYNNQDLELVTLRPMQYEALAKTGDATNGMLVGEYGFKLHNAGKQYRFSALT